MEKKKCTKCGETKSITEFYRRENNYFMSHCKLCCNARSRKNYSENKEHHKEVSKKYVEKHKDEIKIKRHNKFIREQTFLQDIKKNKGCYFCGEKEPIALDFHHRDPKEKEFTIGKIRDAKREVLLKEIAKCEVLCANCHRKLHAGLIELPIL